MAKKNIKKTITIKLDVEMVNVEDKELEKKLVYEYLQELMDDESLDYDVEDK